MKPKTTLKTLVFIIVFLSMGFYFYRHWTSETVWGIFFVVVFIGVPIWLIVTLKLWMRCSQCRKFGVVKVIGAQLRRKGGDFNPCPDDLDSDEDISSLDLCMDLYDLSCRYACENCGFVWEDKPPAGYRSNPAQSSPAGKEDH